VWESLERRGRDNPVYVVGFLTLLAYGFTHYSRFSTTSSLSSQHNKELMSSIMTAPPTIRFATVRSSSTGSTSVYQDFYLTDESKREPSTRLSRNQHSSPGFGCEITRYADGAEYVKFALRSNFDPATLSGVTRAVYDKYWQQIEFVRTGLSAASVGCQFRAEVAVRASGAEGMVASFEGL
jgi:hypothetical protein